VYSGNRLPRDLIVQLCDEADNPSPEENVRVQLTRDAAAIKVDCRLLLPFYWDHNDSLIYYTTVIFLNSFIFTFRTFL